MPPLRRYILSAALVAGGLASPMAGSAATFTGIANPFDIEVLFDVDQDGIADNGGLTQTQRDAFTGAELFWETMLMGNRYDLDLDPLVISARGEGIDGEGNILGSAGWNDAIVTLPFAQNYVYATTGAMRFDTADLDAMEGNGTLFDVIVHEMAHVIGFGSLWTVGSDFSLAGVVDPYVDGSGEYTGSFANALYSLEFGASDGFIPVELDGGSGTANAHWDELTFAGGSRDIMTGYLNAPSGSADAPFGAATLSSTTIAAFADIGYITAATDVLAPVPLPAGMVLSLTGLLGLGAVTRRRRRA